VTAVKEGGGADPVANTQLARVLADARRLSVPVDLIERNLKRATDTSQADYMELTYEGTYFISQIPPPRLPKQD
jgi:transcriptional/translational regulatory protein YebC/TACO1